MLNCMHRFVYGTPTLENLVVAHVQFHFNILIMFTLDTDKKDKFHQITNFTPTNINIIHPPIGKKRTLAYVLPS